MTAVKLGTTAVRTMCVSGMIAVAVYYKDNVCQWNDCCSCVLQGQYVSVE